MSGGSLEDMEVHMRGLTVKEVMEWANCTREEAIKLIQEINDYEDESTLEE